MSGSPPPHIQFPEPLHYGAQTPQPLLTPYENENKLEHAEAQEYMGTPAPKPAGIKKYFKKYYLTPIMVFVVHTALLIASWTFFAVTCANPVALPPDTAVWVGENYQPVTMVVTLASSLFAVISTVTYAAAIRYSIARFLAGGVSLYTIVMSTKLAGASAIRKFSRPYWAIFAAVMAVSVNSISAGFTTLSLPKTIEVKSPMTGFELDMSTPGFQGLMVSNQGKVNADLFNRVIPVTEASGSTAASSKFGVPSYLNVNGFTYTNSTGGVMPVPIQPLHSNILSAQGQQIPANAYIQRTSQTPPPGRLFPTRFTVTQQGFSASINCTQTDLAASTTPSLELKTRAETLFDGSNITLSQMEVGCSGQDKDTVYSNSVLTNAGVDAVLAVACPVADGQSWNVILSGFGNYQDIKATICSVRPELNYVTSSYTDSSSGFNSSTPNFVNISQPWGATPAPWLGTFAVDVFLRGMKVGQTTTGNTMGDTVLAFMRSVPTANDDEAQSMVLEQYIRGVSELSITLLRTVYTQENNGLFDNGTSEIPQDMRTTINGTYYATTIGWFQDSQTAPAVLIAPTIVSLVAIGIILATLFYTKGQTEADDVHEFDPANIAHLMAASSAGGLKTVFPPYEKNDVDKSDIGKMRVTLAEVHPGQYGFVTAEGQGWKGNTPK